MTEGAVIYCLDTSALINPYNRYYGPDVAPWYWAGVGSMLATGRVVISEEVRDEVREQRDGLAEWTRTLEGWYPLTDEVQDRLTQVMARWGHMVRIGRRNRADPVVIATAWALGATIVTEEGPGSEGKPSIPYICGHLGLLRPVSVLEFVRETRMFPASTP